METLTMGNGWTTKPMVMAYTFTVMETNMKGIGLTTCSMDLELKIGLMGFIFYLNTTHVLIKNKKDNNKILFNLNY